MTDGTTFRSAGGIALECEIRRPEGEPRGTAVLCHPLPSHTRPDGRVVTAGGSKDHPILWQARIGLARVGLMVLSFNFRGVMGSEGTFDFGVGEVDDTRAAIDRIRREAEGPTFVFGWSFGSNVALREALTDDRVEALALCGFPLHDPIGDLPQIQLPSPAELAGFDRPVLFCVGEGDRFSPEERVRGFASTLPWVSVRVFPGAGHYFPKQSRDLGAAVGAFAADALFGEASS
jgi:alpha/beta superfamily hydrolase